MAIGTHSGIIKVYGNPGVEFYGQHTSSNNTTDCSIQLLEWIPGSGRFLSISVSNVLTLWEPAGALLVPIKNCILEGKTKKVSAICASNEKTKFWIGTETGSIYEFDVGSFNDSNLIVQIDNLTNQ